MLSRGFFLFCLSTITGPFPIFFFAGVHESTIVSSKMFEKAMPDSGMKKTANLVPRRQSLPHLPITMLRFPNKLPLFVAVVQEAQGGTNVMFSDGPSESVYKYILMFSEFS